MCAQTRPRFILLSERVSGNGVRTHVNSKGNNPLYLRLRGGSNPQHCITQDTKPNTLPTELFQPCKVINFNCWGLRAQILDESFLISCIVVATLQDTWCYGVSTGTGCSCVNVLWLAEMENLICSFYLWQHIQFCKQVQP